MTKPFAASVRAPLPGEPYVGPADELGYALDEPVPAVVTGDDRFPEEVNLLIAALRSVGVGAVIVLSGGVLYGPAVSPNDLPTDWTLCESGSGRRVAAVKYAIKRSEGSEEEWRARATEAGCAIVFLERGAMHRLEIWDKISNALECAGLGVPPAEPPGDEVVKRPPGPAEQPAEQREQQQDSPGEPAENALETHPGDAAPSAAKMPHARELDRLIALAKGKGPPPAGRGDRSAGRALRTSEDPAARSRAGRDLARRRWSRWGT